MLAPYPVELHFRDENGWANGKSNPSHSQYAVDEGVLDAYRDGIKISAETILTLKNRESIHFAKFGYDTRADTLF